MAASETGTKNMTLRLDRELADRVHAIAEVEGQSVANVVRDAIVKHVEERRRDPEFQSLLEESMKRHERLLEMLADG
jgi:predicted DNA-binding protein